MLKEAFLKALVPCTIITFMALCAIAPLWVSMSLMTKQIEKHKIN